MEKIKVSREVAEAIHEGLQEFGNAENLLREHSVILRDYIVLWNGVYNCLNDVSVMELAEILVKDFEVEQTPEEKLREYYEELGVIRDKSLEAKNYHLVGINASRRIGIKDTLNTLGIKIEGINAYKTEGDE